MLFSYSTLLSIIIIIIVSLLHTNRSKLAFQWNRDMQKLRGKINMEFNLFLTLTYTCGRKESVTELWGTWDTIWPLPPTHTHSIETGSFSPQLTCSIFLTAATSSLEILISPCQSDNLAKGKWNWRKHFGYLSLFSRTYVLLLLGTKVLQ